MSKNKRSGTKTGHSQNSLLLYWMHQGLTKLKNQLKKSAILQFFSSYDDMESYAADSLLVRGCRRVKNAVRKKFAKKPRRELGTETLSPNEVGIFAPATLPRSIKNRIGEAVEESKVLCKIKSLLRSLLFVPMMSYGVFVFSFGLFTTVMQALLYFLFGSAESAALDLFIGLALILLSLPIMFKGYEPMANHVSESVLGNLLFRFFRDSSTKEKRKKNARPIFSFFLAGTILGLLTYFAPPMVLLALIALAAIALCILYIPEVGVCLILFLLPFFTGVPHASLWCAAVILYTGFCMLLKVIVGRRSFSFGLLDAAVLVFGLIVLTTGFGGSDTVMNSALLYVAMISGYFTLSNLLRSAAWIKRSIAALTLSSLTVTVTGLLAHFNLLSGSFILWADPSVATVYLLAVTVPALSMMLKSESGGGRMLYFITVTANIVYLFLLGSPIGIFAMGVELLIFFLFYTRKTWTVLLITLLLLPWISYLVWPNFGALSQQFVQSDRIDLWRALGSIFTDAPLTGIGMSDSVLSSAIATQTTADLSLSSTWLRLLVQVGIPGVLVFGAIILLWISSGLTLLHRHSVRERAVCFHLAILVSLIGLCIVGGIFYIWSDNRILLLFWMLAGIGRTLHRNAKRNEIIEPASVEEKRSGGMQADVELTFVSAGRRSDGKDETK